MWKEPIYDRKQSDIDNKTPKGYLNISDLNRIENNIAYIAELMGKKVTTKTWSLYMLPSSSEFDRIKSNITALEEGINFTTYEDLPSNPINTFEKVNLIEALIASINGDFELILGNSMYCGDFEFSNDQLI